MSRIDALAMLAYAVAVLWIGLRASRGAMRERDLLLADRRLPTAAVLGSMVATELSAATFIGVPQAAYVGDWSYLQLAFGALAAKLVLARHVIPAYHRLGVVTVYEVLARRYGPRTHRAAAVCFAVGRTLASGARLYIAALAFSVATGAGIAVAILGCAALAGLYTRWGGLRAVVWTDCLQGAVLVIGAAAALAVVVAGADGGLAAILEWARPAARARIFTLDPLLALGDTRSFGSALIAGFFLTLATHATDHDMVQRLLAARSGRAGGRALAASAWINFPMTALFLAIGTGIAFSHAAGPPAWAQAWQAGDGASAAVLPLFALHALPDGVRGLVFAGLFAAAMSSLDSAICAIAATWVRDIAPRPAPPSGAGAPDAEAAAARRVRRVSAWTCIALASAALAMAAHQSALAARGIAPDLIEFALSAMSVLYGALLGVFGAGALRTTPARDGAGLAALAAGAAVGVALFLHPLLLGATRVAWGYWIPIAAAVSAALVWLAPRRPPRSGGNAAPEMG